MDAEYRRRSAEDISAWWRRILGSGRDLYAAGKVLDLSVPVKYSLLGGPDQSLSKLFVRKDFDLLYTDIAVRVKVNWLGHINGNSGVGKSAFLWYFIIRYGIASQEEFLLVYQSGDFIWEFSSTGEASIFRKDEYPLSRLESALFHLVDQKVEPGDPLGQSVLVAASPDPSNLKNTKQDRPREKFFVYPWDKDEYDELLRLWADDCLVKRTKLGNAVFVEQDADTMMNLYARSAASESGYALMKQVEEMEARLAAADMYYSWFGGIPRLLLQASPDDLSERACEMKVDGSLAKTDLGMATRIILSGAQPDDISWLLLHFKRPVDHGAKYSLDFASVKVKYKFVETLKKEDLLFIMHSSSPELGALRGYLFEQEVVRQVLNSNLAALLMVDNRHCNICNARTIVGDGDRSLRVACASCNRWYHKECAGLDGGDPVPVSWCCRSCDEKKEREGGRGAVLGTGAMLLRYYEGDLTTALLSAGAAARKYVWRPLMKNNAAFDFVVLPRTLGQATVETSHPVPVQAVKEGVEALDAWNKRFNQEAPVDDYLLVFLLMRESFERFGYQSYGDKRRRVSYSAVKGISQAKVAVDSCFQYAHLPPPPNAIVDELSGLQFEDYNLGAMTVPALRGLAKSWGMKAYSFKRQQLIDAMVAWREAEVEVENREYERLSYLINFRGKIAS